MALAGSSYLYGLWPPFSEAVRYLMSYCESYGLEAEIVSGVRSFQEQTELFAQGRTRDEILHSTPLHGARGSVTDATAGNSAHNYGLAVDVEGRDQATVVQLARALGFGTVSWDPAHIEWPNWRQLVGR